MVKHTHEKNSHLTLHHLPTAVGTAAMFTVVVFQHHIRMKRKGFWFSDGKHPEQKAGALAKPPATAVTRSSSWYHSLRQVLSFCSETMMCAWLSTHIRCYFEVNTTICTYFTYIPNKYTAAAVFSLPYFTASSTARERENEENRMQQQTDTWWVGIIYSCCVLCAVC